MQKNYEKFIIWLLITLAIFAVCFSAGLIFTGVLLTAIYLGIFGAVIFGLFLGILILSINMKGFSGV